jgi:hypothetical protein
MPPNLTIVKTANASLADPAVRARVRQMHADGEPLVNMVEALGLPLDGRVRKILESLAPDVVAGIRQATLAAFEADASVLPVDCEVTEAQLDAGEAVAVDVPAVGGALTIRVRPGS